MRVHSFAKRLNLREWNTMQHLQKYKHVPYLYGKDKTHMYMEKYKIDLFDAAVDGGSSPVNAEFCSTLFQFLDRLHREEGIYHGDIKPENICLTDDSWVLVDWESARPHGIRSNIQTPDYSSVYDGAEGDVYSAIMTILVAHIRDHPEKLHSQAHELTDGIFCPAYMYGKDWNHILRNVTL